MPKINVFINGVLAPQFCAYTNGHGGVGKLIVRMVPQPSLPAVNTNIIITDGIVSLTLTGCRLDRSTVKVRGDGWVQQVEYFDRTWKWRFGALDGLYNVRNPDGTLVSGREKSPQQAAILAFSAMLEPFPPDVGLLPNSGDDRPLLNWSCASAWGTLDWLCDRAGCEYGLDVAANQAKIWRLGIGAPLPNDLTVQSVSYSADIAEAPDRIAACGGDVLFESKFKLRAVMEDTDGTLVDKDSVSYVPSGGWDGVDPDDPLNNNAASEEERGLAESTYLQVWEIESMADGGLTVGGYGEVPSIDHCTPIFNGRAADYNSGLGSQQQSARLEGTFAIGGDPQPLENTPDNTVVEGITFRIDSERGLVFTSAPIFKLDANLQPVEADLYLVAAHHVQHPTTFQYVYHKVERNIASNGTGTLPLRRPDVVRRIISQYDGTTLTGTIDNEASVNAVLNAQIDAVLPEFQTSTSHVVRYVGIKPIALDGAIRQVTWVVDCGDTYRDGGAWTIAYRNTEMERGVPRRRERRRIMQVERERTRKEFDDFTRYRSKRKGLV